MTNIKSLIGETLIRVMCWDDDRVYFKTKYGKEFLLHDFEDMLIEKIEGKMQNLIDEPIIEAKKIISEKSLVYKFSTSKGSFTTYWRMTEGKNKSRIIFTEV